MPANGSPPMYRRPDRQIADVGVATGHSQTTFFDDQLADELRIPDHPCADSGLLPDNKDRRLGRADHISDDPVGPRTVGG